MGMPPEVRQTIRGLVDLHCLIAHVPRGDVP